MLRQGFGRWLRMRMAMGMVVIVLVVVIMAAARAVAVWGARGSGSRRGVIMSAAAGGPAGGRRRSDDVRELRGESGIGLGHGAPGVVNREPARPYFL